jgi:excisionase family DNA binding protein
VSIEQLRQDTDHDEWLEPDEAARYLRTTPRHLRRFAEQRLLTHYKLGRKVRYRRGDLDAFLEAGRVDGGLR